jgi:hypothetical protein
MKFVESEYIRKCEVQVTYKDYYLSANTNIVPELPSNVLVIGDLSISLSSRKNLLNYLDVYTNKDLWGPSDDALDSIPIKDVSWISSADGVFEEERMEIKRDLKIVYSNAHGLARLKISGSGVPFKGMRLDGKLYFVTTKDDELCEIWIQVKK